MNISSFLLPKMNVTYVNDTDSALTGLRKMRKSGFSAIPVLSEDSRYLGTISEGDFLWDVYRMAEQEELEDRLDEMPNGETMIDELKEKKIREIRRHKKYPSVRITADMDSLIDTVMNQNFVPVVDDRDMFIGIVTRRSILGYLAGRQYAARQEPASAFTLHNVYDNLEMIQEFNQHSERT